MTHLSVSTELIEHGAFHLAAIRSSSSFMLNFVTQICCFVQAKILNWSCIAIFMCGVKTTFYLGFLGGVFVPQSADHWPVLIHILIPLVQHLNVNQIQLVVRRCSTPNTTEETTYFIPRNPVVDAGTNTDPPVVCCPLLRRFCPCPPRGLLASFITKGSRFSHRKCAACPYLSSFVIQQEYGHIIVARCLIIQCLCPLQSFWQLCSLESCGPSQMTNVFPGATS